MKYENDLHIQLDIFSSKLRDIMIKRGMTYDNGKPDPIDLYNVFNPEKRIDKKERGFFRSAYTDKVRKYNNWINGISFPKNIRDVLELCNKLNCDLDYFFTDMKSSTHDIEFISSKTGLSENSIDRLVQLNDLSKLIPGSQRDKFKVINLILSDIKENNELSSLLEYLVAFCRFDVSPDNDHSYVVNKNGIRNFHPQKTLSGNGYSYNPLESHFNLKDMESMYYLKIWDSVKNLKQKYQKKSDSD